MCAIPWLGQGKDGQCALRIENCGTANGNVCRQEAGRIQSAPVLWYFRLIEELQTT